MLTAVQSVPELAQAARRAAHQLAGLDSATKTGALQAIAAALLERTPEILQANVEDLAAGRESGLSPALLDRLALDEQRIAAMAEGVRRIAALPDPVGEVTDGFRLPNGLEVRKVRVPLGVVAVVYEARPNVTIDAAALCLKSGNAILLRGSSSARQSNAILASVAAAAVTEAGVPEGALALVAGGGREELAELATQAGLVDLIIPRGGEGLKAALKGVATVPVIYAASGNCHVYVDASADLEVARRIVLNAKLQRPGVCNAMETLLVHAEVAESFLPTMLAGLHEAGVKLHGDERTRAVAGAVPVDPASAADWDEEYLALELTVGVLGSVEEAIEHINLHGSGHSEAILTSDTRAARAFQLGVDAACVYVNASTRFTDGGEFGMGAEIGNSTQKLHARGPIGLRELCTFKYLIEGAGHIRPSAVRRRVRLGILGGTFNPPHLGHLICAQEAQLQLSLDRVLLMPTRIPPHKSVVGEPGVEHRLALCRAAVEGDGRLAVSDLEIVRAGTSYTVDTLEELKRQDPDNELVFIVGGDVAAGLPDWRSPGRVLELATLAVAGRRGTSRAVVQEALDQLPGGAQSRFFKMPRIGISSTLLRERVRAGAPIRYMVPAAVSAYIHEHGLYGGPAST